MEGKYQTPLLHPFDLKGGYDGEIERYMLQVGGLKEEEDMLELAHSMRPKEWERKPKGLEERPRLALAPRSVAVVSGGTD